MNQSEIVREILDEIDKTRDELFKIVKILPERAFEKRFDNKWNAPEILSHLNRFEELVCEYFMNYINTKTPKASSEYTGRRLSQKWKDSLKDTNVTYNAPEIMLAKRLLKDEYEKVMIHTHSRLKKVIEETITYAYDKVIIPHPNGAKLNLIEWLELMLIHEKRHIKQLEKLLF